jgi:hypothetical protein
MDWSLGVKAEAKLAGMALRVIPIVFGHLTAGRVKVVWGFSRNTSKMYKKVGPKGLAIYLKANYLLLQHIAGGQADANPFEFGCNVSRTRRGMPRIVNPLHRKLILSGDRDILRFWLTLLGLYRVLPFKGSLKLKSITDPGIDITSFLVKWNEWVPSFLVRLSHLTKSEMVLDPTRDLVIRGLPLIVKSSPNSAGMAASAGLPLDLLAWWSDTEMSLALKEWMEITRSRAIYFEIESIFTGFDRKVAAYFKERARKGTPIKPTPLQFLSDPVGDWKRKAWVRSKWGKPLWFGRLGFKEEPGKIRVFAMVNLITQGLMQPLHLWIFQILRLVPTDGTFNQTSPVDRLIKGFKGTEFVASYDLSSATDRLPVAIQIALLEPIIGSRLANLWARILIGRPYGLPRVAKSYNLGFTSVYYAVGQPMGALSSWAMLAMTHHAIVQYASALAYPNHRRWFDKYALLGDDIVIADKLVAQKYLGIMSAIGVEVGLAKSLVSLTGSLEFAKRTWIRGQPASPFSLAELSIAVSNIAALEEVWRKAKTYGEIRIAAVAKFCAIGYKNVAQLPVAFRLNNRLSRLCGYLCRPGGLFPMTLESWIVSDGPGSISEMDFRSARVVAAMIIQDIVDLIRRVLERSKKEINDAFNIPLMDGRQMTFKNEKDEKGRLVRKRVSKPVYGPIFKESIVGELTPLFNMFFKDWVLSANLTLTSRKASALTVRLREFAKDGSSRGFSGLEATWRWIDDVSAGLSALPSKVDLFSRQDDVVVAPSAIIRLWVKLRRKVAKSKGPKN